MDVCAAERHCAHSSWSILCLVKPIARDADAADSLNSSMLPQAGSQKFSGFGSTSSPRGVVAGELAAGAAGRFVPQSGQTVVVTRMMHEHM